MCMSSPVHVPCACLMTGSPDTGITDDYELPCGCWSTEEQLIFMLLLPAEPSVQPSRFIYCKIGHLFWVFMWCFSSNWKLKKKKSLKEKASWMNTKQVQYFWVVYFYIFTKPSLCDKIYLNGMADWTRTTPMDTPSRGETSGLSIPDKELQTTKDCREKELGY